MHSFVLAGGTTLAPGRMSDSTKCAPVVAPVADLGGNGPLGLRPSDDEVMLNVLGCRLTY